MSQKRKTRETRTEAQAREAMDAHELLDELKVPRSDVGGLLSVFGRIAALRGRIQNADKLADLLIRIHGWDEMGVHADGDFWRHEIAMALAEYRKVS